MMDLSLIQGSPFYELTVLLILATLIGLIGVFLRQPMVVSFIAVGMIVGAPGFNLIQTSANIDLLSELGVTLLLFLVGLKLDIKLIHNLGPVALVTGLGQILITALLGYGLAQLLGMEGSKALIVAIALTFSSTIIIVKILSDAREVDSLYGRIAIGVLIVQDVIVILVMIMLSAQGDSMMGTRVTRLLPNMTSLFLYGLAFLVLFYLFIHYLADKLVIGVAYSQELLIIFSIGWAAFFASLGSYLGFSQELGGLLAGISLASTPFRDAIVARLSSVRDFLLLFFFIGLGARLNLGVLHNQIGTALILSCFVLIIKPLIVMTIMGIMGYRKRTGFLAGISLAQVSEFSLILMALSYKLGWIEAAQMSLVTLVGLITIAISVYMMTYGQHLYQWLDPVLSIFERQKPFKEESLVQERIAHKHYDVIVFGIGRYGSAIAEHLMREGKKVLCVDHSPDEVYAWRSRGYDALYGDACDLEFIAALPLHRVDWVVSAIPLHIFGLTHADPRRLLIEKLTHLQFKGKIAVSTQFFYEIDAFRTMGADLVFLPFYDAAEKAVELMKSELNH